MKDASSYTGAFRELALEIQAHGARLSALESALEEAGAPAPRSEDGRFRTRDEDPEGGREGDPEGGES